MSESVVCVYNGGGAPTVGCGHSSSPVLRHFLLASELLSTIISAKEHKNKENIQGNFKPNNK